jgi:uroporphyrin-III C-methyltransferase/precorrin-2 dehydrogenase/sirohydrochlorin ferrochelatase
VLLLGSGEAAEAKRRLIEEAGGRVVTEPQPGVRLAFVALDEGAETAAAALSARGMLVNVVDRPDLCDFTVPAIVDRAPVLVAIGTGGASASLAKALKERLELLLPRALGRLALAMRAARAQAGGTPGERRQRWAALLAPGAPLDPLVEQAEPETAVAAALAGAGAGAGTRLDRLTLPADPEELTLRDLRLLQQADLLVVPDGVPAAVLALARRDAVRARTLPEPIPPGRTVLLRLAGDAGSD